MSDGLIDAPIAGSSTGNPSITYNGELSCVSELLPRMTIFICDPGIPSPELTFTPAMRPPKV